VAADSDCSQQSTWKLQLALRNDRTAQARRPQQLFSTCQMSSFSAAIEGLFLNSFKNNENNDNDNDNNNDDDAQKHFSSFSPKRSKQKLACLWPRVTCLKQVILVKTFSEPFS
jgi:hypothetical protein